MYLYTKKREKLFSPNKKSRKMNNRYIGSKVHPTGTKESIPTLIQLGIFPFAITKTVYLLKKKINVPLILRL